MEDVKMAPTFVVIRYQGVDVKFLKFILWREV